MPFNPLVTRLPIIGMIGTLLFGLGCGSAQSTSKQMIHISPMKRSEPPQCMSKLKRILRGRHTGSLTLFNQLQEVDGYERGLMWLGLFGNPLQVRIRALLLLGELPGEEAVHILLESAQTAKRSSLRAAALKGLQRPLERLPVSDSRRPQILNMITEAAKADDRRVQEAARSLMLLTSEPLETIKRTNLQN